MLTGLVALPCLVPTLALIAQYAGKTDRLAAAGDSLPKQVVNWNGPAAERIFPYKSSILPVTRVVRAIVSLHTDTLQ